MKSPLFFPEKITICLFSQRIPSTRELIGVRRGGKGSRGSSYGVTTLSRRGQQRRVDEVGLFTGHPWGFHGKKYRKTMENPHISCENPW